MCLLKEPTDATWDELHPQCVSNDVLNIFFNNTDVRSYVRIQIIHEQIEQRLTRFNEISVLLRVSTKSLDMGQALFLEVVLENDVMSQMVYGIYFQNYVKSIGKTNQECIDTLVMNFRKIMEIYGKQRFQILDWALKPTPVMAECSSAD